VKAVVQFMIFLIIVIVLKVTKQRSAIYQNINYIFMVNVKNVQNSKFSCFDCQKEIKIKNDNITNGVICTYEHSGQKIQVLKCHACYKKNKSLTNFQNCEVYSRVVGYLRPVKQWNEGKQVEYMARKEYAIK
jgi:anaerobic ribonucleoside-triphosphate reductase